MCTISLFNFFSTFLSPKKVATLQKVAAMRTQYITIALEDLYQSHNLSAIVRTAECLGIQSIHAIHQKHFPVVDDVIAKGAASWVTTHYYQNSQDCLSFLKKNNYAIVATTLSEDAIALDQLPLDRPCAIFFGTERQGLSKTAIEQADYRIQIPMVGFTHSYNVSASAAIVLYDLVMRLHKSSIDWQLSQQEQYELMVQWMRQMIPGSNELESKFLETA